MNTIKIIFFTSSLFAHKSLNDLATFMQLAPSVRESTAFTKSVIVHADSMVHIFLELISNFITIHTHILILLMSLVIVVCELRKALKTKSANVTRKAH